MKTILLLLSITLSMELYAQDGVTSFLLSDLEWVSSNSENQRWSRNEAHQLDSTIKYYYSPLGSGWLKSDIKSFTYHPSGAVKSISEKILGISMEEIELNPQGKIQCRVTKNWDGNEFEPEYKTQYYYHLNGSSKTDSIYLHDPMGWKAIGYNSYILNTLGQVVERRSFFVDSTSLYQIGKVKFYYNALGNLKRVNSYVHYNAQWDNHFQLNYSYDMDNREIQRVEEKWVNGSWINDLMVEKEFVDGNLTKVEVHHWEEPTWKKRYISSFSYNLDIESDQLNLPFEFGVNLNKVIGRSAKSNHSGMWEINDSTQFFYSGSISTIDQIVELKDVFLQRNPVQNQLLINNQNQTNCQIFIYNNVGKMMTQFESSESVISSDVHYLKTGIYYIKVRSLHQEKVLKFYKE